MDFTKKYEELAKQLGDVIYKLMALEKRKEHLISEIQKLDELAGMMNAQKNQTQGGPN
jgi:DNA repair exonuclease SbcCD ATPase subunit